MYSATRSCSSFWKRRVRLWYVASWVIACRKAYSGSCGVVCRRVRTRSSSRLRCRATSSGGAAGVDQAQQLLQVEGIAAGPLDDLADSVRWQDPARTRELADALPGELHSVVGGQLPERDPGEMREAGECLQRVRLRVGWTCSEHEQHRPVHQVASQGLEQCPGGRVDPMAVLEQQHDRSRRRPLAQHVEQERVEQLSPGRRVERGGQLAVGQREVEDGRKQRRARPEPGDERCLLLLEGARGIYPQQVALDW